VVRVENW